MAFDPNKYKNTTRQQWEDYAEGWNAWAPLLETWLGDATNRMLDMAGVGEGSRVVDVAAGAGGQSVAAAQRAGSTGSVLATDLSPTILTYAAKAAANAGLSNLSTRDLDGERLTDLDAGSFDAATNEFFSNPVRLIREAAQLPAPQPGQPGPFSLADPAVLEGGLIAAGYHDVEIQVVGAPVRLSSAAECVQFETAEGFVGPCELVIAGAVK